MPTLDAEDKRYFITALIVPFIIWWIFTGRKKFGTKGMR